MISRRALLATAAAAVAAGRSARAFSRHDAITLQTPAGRIVKKERLKQSVSRWPYNAIPLPDFCRAS